MNSKTDYSWDRSHNSDINKDIKYYPKNIKELNLIIKTKINKDSFVIKTGGASYFDKSFGPGKHTISLKNFDKISINKKKLFVEVGSGVILKDLINYLLRKKLTLHTIPGGALISIGGAISANVIGKSSSKKFACFGDSILSLKVLNKDGKIKEIKKTISKYIGAFGSYGLILSAKLRLNELKSKNLLIEKKIITSSIHLKKLFDEKYLYKYSIINPFKDKNNFGIFVGADTYLSQKDMKKKITINKYLIIFIMKIFKIFHHQLFLKNFYKVIFLLNIEKKTFINFFDFQFKSSFAYLPHAYKGGLFEIEVLIKDINYLNKIKKFFYDNDIYPKYIILKKQYKSKNNYFYEFSNNGYSVALSFDNIIVQRNMKKFSLFFKSLKKEEIPINHSKNSLFQKAKKNYKEFKDYPHYNFKSFFSSKKLL